MYSEHVSMICARQQFFITGIQCLILRGRISEAIRVVRSTYKGLLEGNLELLFRLKCRQFVEMIGGHDRGDFPSPRLEPSLSCHSDLSTSSGSPNHSGGEGLESPTRTSNGGETSTTLNGEVRTGLNQYWSLSTRTLFLNASFNF